MTRSKCTAGRRGVRSAVLCGSPAREFSRVFVFRNEFFWQDEKKLSVQKARKEWPCKRGAGRCARTAVGAGGHPPPAATANPLVRKVQHHPPPHRVPHRVRAPKVHGGCGRAPGCGGVVVQKAPKSPAVHVPAAQRAPSFRPLRDDFSQPRSNRCWGCVYCEVKTPSLGRGELRPSSWPSAWYSPCTTTRA